MVLVHLQVVSVAPLRAKSATCVGMASEKNHNHWWNKAYIDNLLADRGMYCMATTICLPPYMSSITPQLLQPSCYAAKSLLDSLNAKQTPDAPLSLLPPSSASKKSTEEPFKLQQVSRRLGKVRLVLCMPLGRSYASS